LSGNEEWALEGNAPVPIANNGNGMTVAMKVSSVALKLLNPRGAAFAELSVNDIILRLDQDPRGLEYERVDAASHPLRDMELHLSVQDLTMVDMRAPDPAMHTKIIKCTRSKSGGDESQPLVSVTITKTQRAIQVFRAAKPAAETVPICAEALRELMHGAGDISFLYSDQWNARGTVLFDSAFVSCLALSACIWWSTGCLWQGRLYVNQAGRSLLVHWAWWLWRLVLAHTSIN
jgi:hypothetical protein